MDAILLSDSNIDTIETMFEEIKKILPKWALQIAPEKIQRADSINNQGYKIDLQRILEHICYKLGETNCGL